MGRVRSCPRTVHFADGRVRTFPGVVRKLYRDAFGYLKVTLKIQGLERRVLVHHLVCEAWNGQRPTGQHVRHLNGAADDCRAVNLCWGTPTENHKDSRAHGTAGRPRRYAESVVTMVREAKGKVPGTELSKLTGISKAHISAIQNGKRRALGY